MSQNEITKIIKQKTLPFQTFKNQENRLLTMYCTGKGEDKGHPRTDHEGPDGEQRYKLYSFLNLGARWGWVVSATPWPLYPWERPGTHCKGGWVGPRTGLDENGKNFSRRDSILGPSNPQRVAATTELSRPHNNLLLLLECKISIARTSICNLSSFTCHYPSTATPYVLFSSHENSHDLRALDLGASTADRCL